MAKTVEQQIWDAYYYCTDPRMDGYTQFAKKQALYKIKWLVDDLLPKCPTFVGEQEFVQSRGIDG